MVNWMVNLTSISIARLFKARPSGKGKWMAKCPVHRDRMASLEIKQGRNAGTTIVGCFAGCPKDAVLAHVGLTVRDLFEDSGQWKPTPEILQAWSDEERLRLYERQHALAIMAQAILPDERNYWRMVERNIAIKGRALRCKMDSSFRREREVQRIIKAYGWDALWDSLPVHEGASRGDGGMGMSSGFMEIERVLQKNREQAKSVRGNVCPYRVEFRYPGGTKHWQYFTSLDSAMAADDKECSYGITGRAVIRRPSSRQIQALGPRGGWRRVVTP
jgi:hypothetical protein